MWVDVSRSHRSTQTTGVERVTAGYSKHLLGISEAELGYTVKLTSISAGGALREVNWPALGASSPFSGQRNRVLFSKGDIYFGLDLSLAPLGLNVNEARTLRQKGVTVIQMVYDMFPISYPDSFPLYKNLVFEEWLRFLAECDALIFISRATQTQCEQAMRGRGLRVPKKSMVVALSSFLSREPSTGLESVTENFLPEHGLNFLAVGTMEPRKGYEQLILAFEELWAAGHEINLTIVGKAGWKTKQLERQIKAHPQTGNRLFWKSSVTDEQLAALYFSADGLISNSHDEGFGLPVLEAMSAGLPTLIREIPIYRELFPESFFFDGTSSASIKGGIEAWLKSGQKKSRKPPTYTDGRNATKLTDQLIGFLVKTPQSNQEPLA